MLLPILLMIAAPFIGSFLGVVIRREADFAAIARGRSHCDSCRAPLGAAELIPLVSYAVLKGRCRHCGVAISSFHPAVELMAVIPVAWAALIQSGPLLALSAVLGWILLALAWIDWRSFRLPDVLTIPLLVLGLVSAWFFDSANWLDHLIGAIAAFAVLAGLALAYRWVRGREGLGLGDAKLGAGLGAFIAWQALPALFLLSAVFGLLYFLARSAFSRLSSDDERIAFGPFLALAGWIAWLYGPLLPGWT